MFEKIKFYSKVFFQLLKTDLLIYSKVLISNFIDIVVWTSTLTLVVSYIFPEMGMSSDYGAFYQFGLIVSCSFWDIWTSAIKFISDIDGDKTINYPLILPIPSALVFIEKAIASTIKLVVHCSIILPLGKLLIWNRLDLSSISWFKFILIFLVINLFMSFFSLLISSIVKSMNHIDQIGIRILFPLWFFGGSQYSLQTLNKISPTVAKICLANPVLYAMEGIRAAALGQEGYLSYNLCLSVLVVSTIAFAFIGILNFKKRLDFV